MSPVPGNPSGWVIFKGYFVEFINNLAECQIKNLPTAVLLQLKTDFHNEIERRKITEKASIVREKNKKAKLPAMVDRGMLEIVNASALLSIPVDGIHSMKLPYLRPLLNQNWSHLFTGNFDEEKKYYVYAHVSPDETVFCALREFGGNWGGQPFYIGKGVGLRAYDLKRNQLHGKLIAKCLDRGFTSNDIVKIIKDKLTEREALELEAKYIYFFGAVFDDKKGTLANLDRSMIPEFIGEMTKFSKLKKENKHWMIQWKKDHADILRSANGSN